MFVTISVSVTELYYSSLETKAGRFGRAILIRTMVNRNY